MMIRTPGCQQPGACSRLRHSPQGCMVPRGRMMVFSQWARSSANDPDDPDGIRAISVRGSFMDEGSTAAELSGLNPAVGAGAERRRREYRRTLLPAEPLFHFTAQTAPP